jgi:hypothetical protein
MTEVPQNSSMTFIIFFDKRLFFCDESEFDFKFCVICLILLLSFIIIN